MKKAAIVLKLTKLCEATSDAIGEAKIQPVQIEGAINWGDLYCTEATYCINQNGSEDYRVLIEEAAPGYGPFHEFVCKYLTEHGHPNVQVVTEW